MRRIFHILILMTVAAAAVAGRVRTPDPAGVRKADYVYLEAKAPDYAESPDEQLMLLRRAAAAAPGDPFIEGELAVLTIGLPTADSADREAAYRAIARRFDVAPTDDYYSYVYSSAARLAGRLDDQISIWERLDTLLPSRTDPAMNLAGALVQRYVAKGDTADYRRAMEIFTRLEGAIGPNMQLTNQAAHAMILRGDTLGIIGNLGRLARSAPADVQTNVFVGQVFDAISRPDSAIHYFDVAQAVDPDNGVLHMARAEFYHSRGDSVAFDREIFRALQSPSMEFEQKFDILSEYVVKLYADSTRHGAIEHMFETLQEINPGEAQLHGLYGAYKAATGAHEQAAEQFEYSIDLDPDNQGIWMNLVQAYGALNRLDDELSACRRAIALFHDNPSFYVVGSAILTGKGNYGQALALLDSVSVEELPAKGQSAIYGQRGDINYQLGRRDSAFADYQRAIDIDPDNYMALNNCAYYLAETEQDLARAELYASIAVAGESESATTLDTYAWVLFKKKEYAKAREVMDKVLAMVDAGTAEPSAEVFSHAGDILFMSGDHARAVELWRMAFDIDPDMPLLRKKVEHKTIFFE